MNWTTQFKVVRQLFLLVWLLGLMTAQAQPALNLNELTQLAITNNKDLKAVRSVVAIAGARLVQSGLWSNPSILFSNYDDQQFNNEGEYTRTIGFSQNFPVSGRIAKQKSVARIDVVRAMAEIREAERQLSAQVARAYYAVVLTENRLQQLNYLQRINGELVRVIHNRYDAAEVSKLDDNSARIEYARIEQEKQLLYSLRISQYAALNQLIGQKPGVPLSVQKTLDIQQSFPKLKVLQALAMKNRPDRQGLLLALQRADADRRLAKAERFADWTVGLGVQENRLAVQGVPIQQADRALGVTLSIPLPLLNGNQGRILEAGATGTQALMLLKALNLAIDTEISSNYEQLNALHTSLTQTRRTSLPLGLNNVKMARDAYQNGQISLLNVLQIQRQQNDLQVAYLNTLEKYFQVYVALCTAIGAGASQGLCSYLAYPRNGYVSK